MDDSIIFNRSAFKHGVNMTEEEADALDEYYTKNPPKVDPAKRGGVFTRGSNLKTQRIK